MDINFTTAEERGPGSINSCYNGADCKLRGLHPIREDPHHLPLPLLQAALGRADRVQPKVYCNFLHKVLRGQADPLGS